jgi:hypothetical protein
VHSEIRILVEISEGAIKIGRYKDTWEEACILEVLGSILDRNIGCPDWRGFYCFPQSLQGLSLDRGATASLQVLSNSSIILPSDVILTTPLKYSKMQYIFRIYQSVY